MSKGVFLSLKWHGHALHMTQVPNCTIPCCWAGNMNDTLFVFGNPNPDLTLTPACVSLWLFKRISDRCVTAQAPTFPGARRSHLRSEEKCSLFSLVNLFLVKNESSLTTDSVSFVVEAQDYSGTESCFIINYLL